MGVSETNKAMGEAVRVQTRNRLRSFVGLPDTILGRDIGHLTLRGLTYLELAGNIFICGSNTASSNAELHAHAIKLFWVCAPGYAPLSARGAPRAMRKFEKHFLRFNAATVIGAAQDFIEQTFMENGIFAQKNGGGKKHGKEVPQFCNAAFYIALLAKEFGWDEEKIWDLPMRRILQYANQIRMRYDGDFQPPSLAYHIQLKLLKKGANDGGQS